MSQDLERVYTINLGKVLLSQSQHRAVRAINMIKEFARHHMKVEDIKIEEDLAHQIWAKGVRSPPRKVRVRMSRTDEGYVLVSTYEEEIETKESPKVEEPSKESPKVEEPSKESPKVEEPSKESPKVEEPSKESPKVEEPAKESPKVEEPAKESPKVEEPSKESPKVEEPSKESKKKEIPKDSK